MQQEILDLTKERGSCAKPGFQCDFIRTQNYGVRFLHNFMHSYFSYMKRLFIIYSQEYLDNLQQTNASV